MRYKTAGYWRIEKLKTALLDDVEKIKAVDKSNMINFCMNSAKLYSEAAKLAIKSK